MEGQSLELERDTTWWHDTTAETEGRSPELECDAMEGRSLKLECDTGSQRRSVTRQLKRKVEVSKARWQKRWC